MNTKKEALQFTLRAAAKGVVSEADLDTVYDATPTDVVVAVAAWTVKESTQKLLTDRFKQDGGRIADLVTLHHSDNRNPIILHVLANHAKRAEVDQAVVDVFVLADAARHASAKVLLKARPTTIEALVQFLRADTKSPEENRRRLRVGAHAKCAGVIPPDELKLLFNLPKSSTANLVEEGVLLTPAGQAEITEYLRTNANRVNDLFEQYLAHPTNEVVLTAISGHTSEKMDALLRKELVENDEDDPRTNAAAQLIIQRRNAKADSDTETAETRVVKRRTSRPAEEPVPIAAASVEDNVEDESTPTEELESDGASS